MGRRRPAAQRVGAERRFPRSPKAEKPRRSLRRIVFFFELILRFDFRLFFCDASLGGARFFVFFFFFVLLSEDNHNHRRSRSPHVAVGVTRRLTLRKCLACASHRGRRFACTLPTDTDTVPTTEEPRFALSASPTRPSHAHMCKQQLGRPSDALSDPQPLSFDDSTHPQHAHATRSGKHAADNVSLRDLRIETADGRLTPEINPRETNSAQSIDRKRRRPRRCCCSRDQQRYLASLGLTQPLTPTPAHTPTRLPVRIMGAKQKRVAILQP